MADLIIVPEYIYERSIVKPIYVPNGDLEDPAIFCRYERYKEGGIIIQEIPIELIKINII